MGQLLAFNLYSPTEKPGRRLRDADQSHEDDHVRRAVALQVVYLKGKL
jgi:hypothetical protein